MRQNQGLDTLGRLRDYARTRLHLVQDRTRVWQRLEKLLEGALVKLSSQVSSLTTKSARAMIEAMIAGQRDPQALADLAMKRMRAKKAQIARALEGMMFGDHHGQIARILLDQASFLDRQVAALDDAIEACLQQIPASWGIDGDGTAGPGAGTWPGAAVLPAARRLAEIPGVSEDLAMAIIAETGLDMTRFPTAGHLVSWAGLAPVPNQSGPRTRKPEKGHGNSYLRGYCTQAANGTAGTDTFLGERLRRIAKRRGGARAPGRGRPLHPHHHLAPARQPRSTLHRPRPRPLRHQNRQRQESPQPDPPAPGPRPRRHHHPPGRLKHNTRDQARDQTATGPHPMPANADLISRSVALGIRAGERHEGYGADEANSSPLRRQPQVDFLITVNVGLTV